MPRPKPSPRRGTTKSSSRDSSNRSNSDQKRGKSYKKESSFDRKKKSDFTDSNEKKPFFKREDGRSEEGTRKRSTNSSSQRSNSGRKEKSFGRSKESSFDRKKKSDFTDSSEKKPFYKKESGRSEEGTRKRSTYGSSQRSDSGRKEKSYGRSKESSFDRKKKSDFTDSSEKKPFYKKEEKRSGGNVARRSTYGAQRSNAGRQGEEPYRKDENSSQKKYRKRSDSDFKETPKKRSSFKKEIEKTDTISTDQQQEVIPETIRLNKYISNSGVCSRREADELIKMGVISVNGTVITELGYKVNLRDVVRHESKILRAEKPVYILLNKPKGFLTTTRDPQDRNTVMQIIANAVKERVYPVGRLDRNTTGLLFLTNDGELAEKLSHPSYKAKKIYKVELDKPLTKADYQQILEGVKLEEGKALVDDLAIVSSDNKTVGIELHIGWNRVIRRIFEALGYEVVKLDRSVYAGLDKKDLPRGHWRFLSKEEVVRLKHFQ